MWSNPLHLNHLEERRKTRENPKNLLTSRRLQKPKTPMLGEKTKERKNILAWYVRKTTSPNTCPHLVEVHQYLKRGGSPSQPVVLTNPFPQQQQMITQVPAPPPNGNAESSTTNVMMVKSMVALTTREKNYDSQEGEPSSKDPPSTTPPNGPLTLEKPWLLNLPSTLQKGYFDGPLII
jgi:hypothetical protein